MCACWKAKGNEPPRGLQELVGARVDAGFALHGFQQHAANLRALLGEERFQRGDVVGRRRDEAVGQRLEDLLLDRLGRRGQRGQGAAVEAALQRHDEPGRLRLAARLGAHAPVQACQLDGAFVGLGAGVREEGLPRHLLIGGRGLVEQVGQALRKLAATFYIVVVAHVHEARGLFGDRGDERGMAVPHADDADAPDEVQVLAPLGVAHRHAPAAFQLDRLASEGVHDVALFEVLLLLQGHGSLRFPATVGGRCSNA